MRKLFQCYIIDDEPDARQVLRTFIGKVPFLELVGESGDPVQALFQISQSKPDLLFLDIEMSGMTGFEFIRSLHAYKPKVIMVTAHAGHALEGFDHDVADYLLKPVAIDRFFKAVHKATGMPGEKNNHKSNVAPETHILVDQNKKLLRIDFNDIEEVEAMRDYIKIHTKDNTIVTHSTLVGMQKRLPREVFIKVNRSSILRKNAIVQIDGNEITLRSGKKIMIGTTYREQVRGYLHSERISGKS